MNRTDIENQLLQESRRGLLVQQINGINGFFLIESSVYQSVYFVNPLY